MKRGENSKGEGRNFLNRDSEVLEKFQTATNYFDTNGIFLQGNVGTRSMTFFFRSLLFLLTNKQLCNLIQTEKSYLIIRSFI